MTAEPAARVSSSAEYGGVEVEYVDPGRGRERRLPRSRLARSLRRIAPATASRPDAPASSPMVLFARTDRGYPRVLIALCRSGS